MSDYTNTFNGAAKDAANDTILGAQHDTQYDAVQTAVATKANKITSPTVDRVLTMTGGGDLKDSGKTVAQILTDAVDKMFPIGAIYLSAVSTNPSTLLGGTGTWTRIAQGRTLIGEGTGSGLTARTAGATLGTEDAVVVQHNHGVTDPGHSHTFNIGASGTGSAESGNSSSPVSTASATTGITVDNEGVSGVGQNMQPSLVVYIWQRTA
jgi:hypothetical protein